MFKHIENAHKTRLTESSTNNTISLEHTVCVFVSHSFIEYASNITFLSHCLITESSEGIFKSYFEYLDYLTILLYTK